MNLFADATGDHQWIHVDPERAKPEPLRRPIAHGYLTLSLGPALMPQILRVEGMARWASTTAAGKVRFPSPVPVGSKLRLGAELDAVDDLGGGGAQISMTFTFEVEGADQAVLRGRDHLPVLTPDVPHFRQLGIASSRSESGLLAQVAA